MSGLINLKKMVRQMQGHVYMSLCLGGEELGVSPFVLLTKLLTFVLSDQR